MPLELPAKHALPQSAAKVDDGPASDESDEMSDEQMWRLLKEAEVRLRKKAGDKPKHGAPSKLIHRPLPKLDVAPIEHDRKASDTRSTATARPSKRTLDDPVIVAHKPAKAKKVTAGPEWHDMPRTELTPEIKRDLQLIKHRNVLDPHRHYKKDGGKFKAPEFFQVGTIVEGPTEFFSARLNNRDRRETLVDEVLAGEKETRRFKNKFNEIQVTKKSGKKAHYKALQAKRAKKFKR